MNESPLPEIILNYKCAKGPQIISGRAGSRGGAHNHIILGPHLSLFATTGGGASFLLLVVTEARTAGVGSGCISNTEPM
jgi:hypothetical protein